MAEHLDGNVGKGKDREKPAKYKLNVQNKTIQWGEPAITVAVAIKEAGFDPDKPWIIILKAAGKPKMEVGLDYVIDLTDPGVEKLRLTPKDVGNGEAPWVARCDFEVLDEDGAFLDELGLRWETLIDGESRWLVIHDYPLPQGYRAETASLALLIPREYPDAQLDMFYLHPAASLASGARLDRCDATVEIEGKIYQRWSRHRQGVPWDPTMDNVATHLGLVEGCLAREVER